MFPIKTSKRNSGMEKSGIFVLHTQNSHSHIFNVLLRESLHVTCILYKLQFFLLFYTIIQIVIHDYLIGDT